MRRVNVDNVDKKIRKSVQVDFIRVVSLSIAIIGLFALMISMSTNIGQNYTNGLFFIILSIYLGLIIGYLALKSRLKIGL